MSRSVTIEPGNHHITLQDNETILQGALRSGLVIPYACQSGACGSCKGKILNGTVEHSAYQSHALTQDELSQGMSLLCCAHPTSDDVVVEVRVQEAGGFTPKKLPCRVESVEHANHDVVILKLKLPATENFQFRAGQYIDFLLKDGKRRSYSMANSPHDASFIELHIRHYQTGNFSHFAFSELKEKAILRFEGPKGNFYLREESDKPIIFMAGATGFAPIKGIIEYAKHQGITRPMVLYWGVKCKNDLYLNDLAASWQTGDGQFTYIPVLSDPLPEDQWAGRTGLVHEAILNDFEDLSGYQVYACGAPVMVEAGYNAFTQTRNLPREEFFSDPFTPSVDSK